MDLAGEQVERDRRGADEWRLGVADHLRKGGGDLAGADVDDVMGGADRLRDELLLGPLVVGRIIEGDREGPQLTLLLDLGKGADQARVEPAGEVGADRNVGPQPQSDAVAQGCSLEIAVAGGRADRGRAATSAAARRSRPAPRRAAPPGSSCRTPAKAVRGACGAHRVKT